MSDGTPTHTSPRPLTKVQRGIRDLFDLVYPERSAQNRDLPDLLAAGQKAAFSLPLEQHLTEASSVRSFSYFSSLFLARKVLPAADINPVPTLEKWSVPAVENPAFCRTIDYVCARLFYRGWDKKYARFCRSVKISANSSMEAGRGKGGGVGAYVDAGLSLLDFYSLTREGRPIDPLRKVEIVKKDGKSRMVTVASLYQQQLLPLHLTIYDHLSRQKWLLKRADKMSVLKEFVERSGEFFCSGDYEAATDNLNSAHSRRILSNILCQSDSVPVGIHLAALDSLTGYVAYDGSIYAQRNGQLMGNLLSFPLLCLTNFITVVHALGYDRANTIPLKINGDDIVFRASRRECSRWMDLVSQSGLVLSRGKTLLHSRFFSINSAFFRATPKSVRVVPVIRASTCFKKAKNETAFSGLVKSATWGFYGKIRRRITCFLARYHYAVLEGGEASLTRGMGLQLSPEEFLKDYGLMTREARLLELPPHLDRLRQRKAPSAFSLQNFKRYPVDKLCPSCVADARSQMTIAANVWAFRKIERKKIKESDVPVSIIRRPRLGMKLLIAGSGKTRVRDWMRAKMRTVIDVVWGRSERFKPPGRPEFVWADPLDMPFCRCAWSEFSDVEFVVGSL